jgi:hypothetical protein
VLDRGQDPDQLAVAPFERAGQPVVALGQARQLVLAADDDRRRQVAGRDPVDGRRDRPQGRRQVGGQQVGDEDRDQGDQGHEQEQQAGQGRRRIGQPLGEHEDQPKTASGMTAAAISEKVSRVRKPIPAPKVGAGIARSWKGASSVVGAGLAGWSPARRGAELGGGLVVVRGRDDLVAGLAGRGHSTPPTSVETSR